MGSRGRMDINSLLSPQDSPDKSRPDHPTRAYSDDSGAVKKPGRGRRSDSLLQQATTASPLYSVGTSAPNIHYSINGYPKSHQQQQQQRAPSPSPPSVVTPSSSRSVHSGTSSPIDARRSYPHASQPPTQRNDSTEKMDFLADLASMQQQQQHPHPHHHPQQQQQRAPHASAQLRSNTETNPSRRSSLNPAGPRKSSTIGDLQMNDTPPPATLGPQALATKSLSKGEIEKVNELTKQLSENTFLYDSHLQLISLLHQGFRNYLEQDDEDHTTRNPGNYPLLSELRQARAAMDSRFPVGEDHYVQWIEDECMLADRPEERVAVMELCQKAVQEEVGSARIWRMYGDWMLLLHKKANDLSSSYDNNSLEQHPVVGRVLAQQVWSDEDKTLGKELFGWDPMLNVWQQGVQAAEWHIDSSHLVWDPYTGILLHELSSDPSAQKIGFVRSLFGNRLGQPHATLDDTFQTFSRFVSEYDSANYEATMVAANQQANKTKHEYGLRQDWEAALLRAQEAGDRNSEWTAMTQYIEWETEQNKKKTAAPYSLDLLLSLYERANLRFSTDPNFWEDHVDLITMHPELKRDLLTITHLATRHCPWSGILWSKRLTVLEVAEKEFSELEDVKHHATSTGLLGEVGSMDEVIEVYSAWCGYLRRKAVAVSANEDDIDIAEVGIRSAIENVKEMGEKRYGKQFTGDPRFRIERIYAKFLSQVDRREDSRKVWERLANTHGDKWEFWDKFYAFEMLLWVIERAEMGNLRMIPERATAVLHQAMTRPNVDWPEHLIEMYQHHCRQHETAARIKEAQTETRRVTREVAKRRAREAADAAAAQEIQDQELSANAENEMHHNPNAGDKRKREYNQSDDENAAKRPRAHQNGAMQFSGALPTLGNETSSTVAEPKRDREHTTIIVKSLPQDTEERRVRSFFSDCGKILRVQLHQENSSTTATIEFESREDVLSAKTKSMKLFDGNSIDIQVGTGTILWVTNYPPEVDEKYIHELFSPYGEVVDVRFPSLAANTRRRFCYVQFLTPEQALAATQLDGKPLSGRFKQFELVVKISDPLAKKQRENAMSEGRELFVNNLERSAHEEDVKAVFDPYGTVVQVRIPRHHGRTGLVSGVSKGHAFVVFATKEEATSALEMNMKEFRGRVLSVEFAKSNKRNATTIKAFSASPAPDAHQNAGSPESTTSTTAAPSGKPSTNARNRIFVIGNIPDTVNYSRISALLEPYGTLLRIVHTPEENEALVEFETEADAGKARLAMEGYELQSGVFLEVNAYRKKDPRNQGQDKAPVSNAKGNAKGLLFQPPIRRPAQSNAPRRGGHGGLGIKRANTSRTNGGDAGAKTNGDAVSAASKSNSDFKAMLTKTE